MTEYILLPDRGLRATLRLPEALHTLGRMSGARSTGSPLKFRLDAPPGAPAGLPAPLIDVIDSIREDGPKLVEISDGEMVRPSLRQAGLRLEPVRHYAPAVVAARPPAPDPGSMGLPLKVTIQDAVTGAAVEGAQVTVYTDWLNRLGAQASTDATGTATLAVGPPPVVVERAEVEPPPTGYWGAFRTRITLNGADVVRVEPLRLSVADALRHFYTSAPGDGAGVKVGIIDTGVSLNHPDLTVQGGRNTVRGEPRSDFGDNGNPHGTHVAGIIAARGAPPTGLSGIAPEAVIRSYRVFGAGLPTSTNYSIVKAIINAVDDGCDILNLSLAGQPRDEVLREALLDAKEMGVLVVCAAGNEGRKPVSVPANYGIGLAVSALGRMGTFPAGSLEESYVDRSPAGTDPADFVASFSNIGNIDHIAPGVGIVSTVPGGYAPLSGTSMASPVVAGLAARLLSRNPAVLSAPRDVNRTLALIRLLGNAVNVRGFGFSYEGSGLPL